MGADLVVSRNSDMLIERHEEFLGNFPNCILYTSWRNPQIFNNFPFTSLSLHKKFNFSILFCINGKEFVFPFIHVKSIWQRCRFRCQLCLRKFSYTYILSFKKLLNFENFSLWSSEFRFKFCFTVLVICFPFSI